MPVVEVCRKNGVVCNTFYRWKKKYGGMAVARSCVNGHPASRSQGTSSFPHTRIVPYRRECGSSVRLGDGLGDVSQAIGSSVDAHDMAVVQQAVEKRRGKDLVACEHVRPFPDALVRGDDGAGPLVAVADDLEQQVRVPPVHGLEAQFIDDQ